MKLANRLAFITGGGRGIGRAIAIAFAREGASIVVTARTLEQVENFATEIREQSNVDTLAVECDVRNAQWVLDAFATTRERFGRGPDIVVNNAGVVQTARFIDTDEEMWVYHRSEERRVGKEW